MGQFVAGRSRGEEQKRKEGVPVGGLRSVSFSALSCSDILVLRNQKHLEHSQDAVRQPLSLCVCPSFSLFILCLCLLVFVSCLSSASVF